MITQRLIINYLKMYKIPGKVLNFIEKTIKTWKMELTVRGRSLAETIVQRGIFQGGGLSRLLLITSMIPLNHILRKCTAGYKLSKSQKKDQNPGVHWHQTVGKRNGNSSTHSENIQSRERDGIWHRKICHASNEIGKRQLTDRIKLPNEDKIRTLGEKENSKYLGILEVVTIK